MRNGGPLPQHRRSDIPVTMGADASVGKGLRAVQKPSGWGSVSSIEEGCFDLWVVTLCSHRKTHRDSWFQGGRIHLGISSPSWSWSHRDYLQCFLHQKYHYRHFIQFSVTFSFHLFHEIPGSFTGLLISSEFSNLELFWVIIIPRVEYNLVQEFGFI